MTGALLVDKPSGPTSHDVVAFTRRLLQTSRVGHTGTLDPLATGLLVLLIGHATRLAQYLVTDEKEYIADVRLGIATPTYDSQSLADPRASGRGETTVTRAAIEAALPDFLGTFPQIPPPYSAKKVQGVRAYEKARRHEALDLKPVEVTVHELELLSCDARPDGLVRLRVAASAGFYVRSLAHDLGQVLGCGAHLEGLRRTRAGRFRVEDAAPLDRLQAAGPGAAERLIPVNALLADFPAVTLTDEGLRRAGKGNSLAPHHVQGAFPALAAGHHVRVLQPSGEVLAVAETRLDGLLHPLLVLR